jgi:phage antirepressor YoqD-like protein
VLPQIRKTGAYSIKALPQTYAQALRELADTVEQKALLEAKIEQDAPKVEFFDAVADAEGLHDIGTVAKMLGWGRNNLFAHLRKMRILMSNNMPMQKFVNRGYFVVREKLIDMGGSAVVKPQTYVTGKGLQWLQEKIVPPYEGRKKPHLSGKAKIEGHWRHPLAGNRQEIGG